MQRWFVCRRDAGSTKIFAIDYDEKLFKCEQNWTVIFSADKKKSKYWQYREFRKAGNVLSHLICDSFNVDYDRMDMIVR